MAEHPAGRRVAVAFFGLRTGATLGRSGERIGSFVIPIIAIRLLSETVFEMGLLTTFEHSAVLVTGTRVLPAQGD